MYKQQRDQKGNLIDSVLFQGDGFVISIPPNVENIDYQAYLKWLEEGNTPEPADPPPPDPTAQEKLINAGLSVEELKQLLGLN